MGDRTEGKQQTGRLEKDCGPRLLTQLHSETLGSLPDLLPVPQFHHLNNRNLSI